MPALPCWVRTAALISTVAVAPGCAKDEVNVAGDIFASWCGRRVQSPEECMGDEVQYVELVAADGRAATGVHCEAYGKDCYELVDAERTPGGIRYAYEFDVFRVEAELELSDHGARLTGELTSTKCGNCSSDVTLYRIAP